MPRKKDKEGIKENSGRAQSIWREQGLTEMSLAEITTWGGYYLKSVRNNYLQKIKFALLTVCQVSCLL